MLSSVIIGVSWNRGRDNARDTGKTPADRRTDRSHARNPELYPFAPSRAGAHAIRARIGVEDAELWILR
jgi:hypothetical protein